jgi:hypothetical protein
MLSTDMIRITTRLADGTCAAWIPNFSQRRDFAADLLQEQQQQGAIRVYSLGLHLAGAELSQGRFASTGIAWDDNRSLISGEDQYRLCFLRHGFCGAGSRGVVARCSGV